MSKARVTKVIDGDTLRVRNKSIRLANVDAPEMGSRWGAWAKNELKNMVQGKTISYKPVGKSYDRVVAQVKVGSRSINQAMRNKLR